MQRVHIVAVAGLGFGLIARLAMANPADDLRTRVAAGGIQFEDDPLRALPVRPPDVRKGEYRTMVGLSASSLRAEFEVPDGAKASTLLYVEGNGLTTSYPAEPLGWGHRTRWDLGVGLGVRGATAGAMGGFAAETGGLLTTDTHGGGFLAAIGASADGVSKPGARFRARTEIPLGYVASRGQVRLEFSGVPALGLLGLEHGATAGPLWLGARLRALAWHVSAGLELSEAVAGNDGSEAQASVCAHAVRLSLCSFLVDTTIHASHDSHLVEVGFRLGFGGKSTSIEVTRPMPSGGSMRTR